MADRLELPALTTISPTLAEVMRSCSLRAGFSRARASSFVLGNPKGWLGTAYHEVLEKLSQVDLGREPFDIIIERLWDTAIASQYERASNHPLDHRFGSPSTWPGYYIARASVYLRAQELISISAHPPTRPSSATATNVAAQTIIRERELAACGGRLVGRPDVVRFAEIIDYKSGGIFESAEDAHPEQVKGAYVRQLQVYGYLVREALGWWPKRALLLPLAGPAVEIALDPAACELEAREAVALLDTYNAKITAKMAPIEFAAPAPSACKWCPYKAVCPAFWQSASPAWSGQLVPSQVD